MLAVTDNVLAFELDDRGLDRLAKSLGRDAGFLDLGGRQDRGELFAAVAAGQIHLAGRFHQHLADVAEHFVAGRVAVRVVELLEMVDVEDHQREWRLPALPLGEAALHLVVERAAIGQIGERIGAGFGFVAAQVGGLGRDLLFGQGQPRLQFVVGVDHAADRGEDGIRFVARAFVGDRVQLGS